MPLRRDTVLFRFVAGLTRGGAPQVLNATYQLKALDCRHLLRSLSASWRIELQSTCLVAGPDQLIASPA